MQCNKKQQKKFSKKNIRKNMNYKKEPVSRYILFSTNYITGEDEVRVINKYKEVKND